MQAPLIPYITGFDTQLSISKIHFDFANKLLVLLQQDLSNLFFKQQKSFMSPYWASNKHFIYHGIKTCCSYSSFLPKPCIIYLKSKTIVRVVIIWRYLYWKYSFIILWFILSSNCNPLGTVTWLICYCSRDLWRIKEELWIENIWNSLGFFSIAGIPVDFQENIMFVVQVKFGCYEWAILQGEACFGDLSAQP